MPEPSDLLSYAEVAAEVGVSKQQVKIWAQAREFPIIDISHKIKRIRRSDLDAFLESRRSESRHAG